MSNQVFPAQVRGLGFTVNKTIEDSVISQESAGFTGTRILQSQNPRWHFSLMYEFLIDNILKPNPALAYTDLKTLLGFVAGRSVSYDDFLFSDPDDNSVGPGIVTAVWQPNYPYMLGAIVLLSGHAIQVIIAPGGARSGLVAPTVGTTFTDGGLTWADLGTSTGYPNPQAQLQVFNDGAGTYYSPIQRNLGGQFYEDVTDLASALTVYDNGTLTTNYALQFGGFSIPGASWEGMYLKWSAAPTGPVTATFNFYFRVTFEDSAEDFEKWANQWWAIGGPEGSRGKGELRMKTFKPAANAATGIFVPNLPSPPVAACSGATQMVELYPTKVVLNSFPGISVATGVAGPNAWADLELNVVGLGSPKANVVFSGYALPPNVPAAAVKCVYGYAGTGSITNPAGIGFSWDISLPSFFLCGGANGFHNPFQQIQVSRIDQGFSVLYPPASSFPFNQITANAILAASLPGQVLPIYHAYFIPRLIVFY